MRIDPSKRGYTAVYRENEVNHCPGCGRTHWHIGRLMAECAFCTTAIPLPVSAPERRPVIIHKNGNTKSRFSFAMAG